jgi:predicted dehydrogenase
MQIGILGTASVAKTALLNPAKKIPSAEIRAIASRDLSKAAAFAKKHNIPKYYAPYQSLLDDPKIDLVYICLPNSLHCEWTIKALLSGKHVLCEKPLASNAKEVEQIQKAAAKTGKYVFEAMHHLYHPLTARIREIISQGEIGTIQSVSSDLNLYLYRSNNIRFSYELSGGALMDAGCYPLSLLRNILGAEPQVLFANAHKMNDQIDSQMRAQLLFPEGIKGEISCSLRTPLWKWQMQLKVQGSKGKLYVLNPFAPHFINLIVKNKKFEWADLGKSSYQYQLEAVIHAIENNRSEKLTDSLGNMRAIDAIYRAAGMEPRGLIDVTSLPVGMA